MAANVTSTPHPKPLLLPHDVLEQLDIGHAINVATLAAYAWDWLMSISEEVDLCSRRKMTLPIGIYFLSRIGALLFSVLVVTFNLSPIAHCQIFAYLLGACAVIVIPWTSALFFFRVRAVYCGNKVITIIFGLLWLAIFAVCFPGALSPKATHIGTSQICIITKISLAGSLPFAMGTLFATLVFLAISFRIISYAAVGDTFSERTISFFRGAGLPNVSKSLLRGGQLYYSAMIPLNCALIALMLSPVSPVYQSMFLLPQVALDSCMACRVFRGLRIGYIQDIDDGASKATATCVFRNRHMGSNTYGLAVSQSTAVVVMPRNSGSRFRENVDGDKSNNGEAVAI